MMFLSKMHNVLNQYKVGTVYSFDTKIQYKDVPTSLPFLNKMHNALN